MAGRIRQHVNPFSLEHLETGAQRLSLPTDRRIVVDLGCGAGHFLFRLWSHDPAAYYIGVEIRKALVDDINRAARRRNHAPIRGVYANLLFDLDALFPQASLDLITINFPDPWFKKRHKNRRVLSPPLAHALVSALKPNGGLFFQSDIFELALDTLALLEERSPPMVNTQAPWRFARTNPLGVCTQRELACRRKNRPIWRVFFRRTES
jgi:tRNA (guanine-N7-)-methyltransferase